MKKANMRAALVGLAFVLPVLAIDRIVKIWAENLLEGAPDIIPGVLGLRLAHNTGVAFSMFSGAEAITIALRGVVVLGILMYIFGGNPVKTLGKIGVMGRWLIVAGGLGNLYDSVVYGYVVDMFEFRFINFAIFNVADISVCVGAGMAILGYMLSERASRRNEN